MTKRALKGAAAGERVEVLSDTETARGNLMSYLASLGFEPVCTAADGVFRIVFTVGADGMDPGRMGQPLPLAGCEAAPAPQGGYAVVIRSRFMGSGDDELGALLMRSCINSLGELDAQPALVALYNSGVMLAVEATDTAVSLSALAARGVRVLVCGTCVDYYGVKERLAVGTVSNMLAINEALTGADRIIYP